MELTLNKPLNLLAVINKTIKQLNNSDKIWWRGHADSSWGLIPSVFRKYEHDYEVKITNHFKRIAPALYNQCPTDDFDWLCLMQHYGLPTRLLDWTESPLVALYFAVFDEQYDSKSGILYAMNPKSLNKDQISTNAIAAVQKPIVQKIAHDAFIHKSDGDFNVVAVYPNYTDIRMLVQRSVVTIHDSSMPIEEISRDSEKFLHKIFIPAEYKEQLRQVLTMLGVNLLGIFPDLQNLAKDLKNSNIPPETAEFT